MQASENLDLVLNKKRSRFTKKIKKIKKIKKKKSSFINQSSKEISTGQRKNETNGDKIEKHKHRLEIPSGSASKELKNSIGIDNSNFDISFPNYSKNNQLNAIILKTASGSHIFRPGRPKKKSNKPCILCSKFKCPPGVEIIKFKSYDDYITFILNFFNQIESQQKKGENRLPDDLYNRIMAQKKNVHQIKELYKKYLSKSENKLKGPKRFCTNCIANLFREQNGVYSIYESLKDDDELASLEPKKKLEIIQGLHSLIEKEKEQGKAKGYQSQNAYQNEARDFGKRTGEENESFFDINNNGNEYFKDNIFDIILGDGKEFDGKTDFLMGGMPQNFNPIDEQKKIELTYNYNYKPNFFLDYHKSSSNEQINFNDNKLGRSMFLPYDDFQPINFPNQNENIFPSQGNFGSFGHLLNSPNYPFQFPFQNDFNFSKSPQTNLYFCDNYLDKIWIASNESLKYLNYYQNKIEQLSDGQTENSETVSELSGTQVQFVETINQMLKAINDYQILLRYLKG